MRRGVILGLLLIAVSLALQSSERPTTFTTSKGVRRLIEGAHLRRSLIFDGGALRLDPPTGAPGMTEARALALWQARDFGCCQFVGDVNVFLARVTLRLPSQPQPNEWPAPSFQDRQSWVIVWDFTGPHSCPALAKLPASPMPEPTHIEMIAADTSNLGVSYSTAGSFCGFQEKAAATAATYGLSVPWRIIKTTTNSCTPRRVSPCGRLYKNGVVEFTLPICARQSGGESGIGPHGADLQIFVVVPLTGAGCDGTKTNQTEMLVAGNPSSPTMSLNRSFRSQGDTLTYFDGASHTLHFSS